MIGTYNVFEAAHQCGARRVADASRGGILPRSFYPRTMQRTAQMLPKPDSYYTISKVFGESIGYMYSARFDMESVSVRIGNFKADRDQPEHPHQLSHGDCVRVFEQAITHPGVKYEAVFGVSDSDWPLYDLDHGRKVIGYHPQDRSHVPEEDRK
jgi:uronate dehydrogenase